MGIFVRRQDKVSTQVLSSLIRKQSLNPVPGWRLSANSTLLSPSAQETFFFLACIFCLTSSLVCATSVCATLSPKAAANKWQTRPKQCWIQSFWQDFWQNIWINVHLLVCRTENERVQTAFSCVLLALYPGIIFRSNPASPSCWAFVPVTCQASDWLTCPCALRLHRHLLVLACARPPRQSASAVGCSLWMCRCVDYLKIPSAVYIFFLSVRF